MIRVKTQATDLRTVMYAESLKGVCVCVKVWTSRRLALENKKEVREDKREACGVRACGVRAWAVHLEVSLG